MPMSREWVLIQLLKVPGSTFASLQIFRSDNPLSSIALSKISRIVIVLCVEYHLTSCVESHILPIVSDTLTQ